MQCIICLKTEGACMQCLSPRCFISFHIECARRENYFMEVEKREKDKVFKIFCEKHRPLKIVKEMEEKDKQTIEEIQKFCKVIEKSVEIDRRTSAKQRKQEKAEREKQMLKEVKIRPQKQKGSGGEVKLKKWREKDKKVLFDRVKEKYLMLRKMRINIYRVDQNNRDKKN